MNTGRAFRTVQVVASDRDRRPRLWVPVLDGADRLGVLEIRVESATELYDPGLREQCGWLANLLGYLIVSMEAYSPFFRTAGNLAAIAYKQ